MDKFWEGRNASVEDNSLPFQDTANLLNKSASKQTA
jgi:hypothetical protein